MVFFLVLVVGVAGRSFRIWLVPVLGKDVGGTESGRWPRGGAGLEGMFESV